MFQVITTMYHVALSHKPNSCRNTMTNIFVHTFIFRQDLVFKNEPRFVKSKAAACTLSVSAQAELGRQSPLLWIFSFKGPWHIV